MPAEAPDAPSEDANITEALLSPHYDKVFQSFAQTVPASRLTSYVTQAFHAGWVAGYIAWRSQEDERHDSGGMEP